MDQSHYQRTREKLQNFGAPSLSLVELVQVVVGSGGGKLSVATIAREIEKVLSEGQVTMDTLVNTKGVGLALACRILAAIELSKRMK
jgi:DNA repair protein RadC